MLIKKICIVVLLFFSLVNSFELEVQAVEKFQDRNQDGISKLDAAGIDSGITTGESIETVVLAWINFFLVFVAILMFISILYAGAMMILGGSTVDYFTKGRNILLFMFLGMVIILSAYAIVNTMLGSGDFSFFDET